MESNEFELNSSAKADFVDSKIKEMMVCGFLDEAIALYPLYNRMVNEIISPYDHVNGKSEAHALKTVNIYMSLLRCDHFESMLAFDKWSKELTERYIEKLEKNGFSILKISVCEGGRSSNRFAISKQG